MRIGDTPIIGTGSWRLSSEQPPLGLRRLLFHVSDDLHEVLEPYKTNTESKPCICLSEGSFLGYLGQWLYIFELKTLLRDFRVVRTETAGLELGMHAFGSAYRYRSKELGHEYRIYEPILVSSYALGVAQNFEANKGMLERRVHGEMVRMAEVDWMEDEERGIER